MKHPAHYQSVLQTWVMQLPLRAQGTLLTCVRGCDLVPKYPLDSLERRLVSALRHSFMVPADAREVDSEPGCFFRSEVPIEFRASELGHYPLHWYTHVMHAAEVLAYSHPVLDVCSAWFKVYVKLVTALHCTPETETEWFDRMNEDRVATGTIVG